MFKKTLGSRSTQDRAFGAAVKFARRTVVSGTLAMTLAVAFVAPLGVSAPQARTVALAAAHGALAGAPNAWCSGASGPC